MSTPTQSGLWSIVPPASCRALHFVASGQQPGWRRDRPRGRPRALYSEMVIELGWAEQSWNPVARELDLICTGGRKPYAWIVTRTGQKRRLRVYPIPQREVAE